MSPPEQVKEVNSQLSSFSFFLIIFNTDSVYKWNALRWLQAISLDNPPSATKVHLITVLFKSCCKKNCEKFIYWIVGKNCKYWFVLLKILNEWNSRFVFSTFFLKVYWILSIIFIQNSNRFGVIILWLCILGVIKNYVTYLQFEIIKYYCKFLILF